MQSINQHIESHLENTFCKKSTQTLSHAFKKHGFVKIPTIVSDDFKKNVHDEAYQLLENHSERRDITLATTDNTPRHLSVVHSEMVSQHGHLIRSCSESKPFLSFLSKIAGEELLLDVKSDEKFVITKQEFKGDTHGWHWGDYAFALIWLIKVPPVTSGGMLQCIPNTTWDKENPRINQYLCEHPITTYAFEPNDIYFLRADTTLHRTVPLSQNVDRIMLNMTWACHADIEKNSLQEDDRWWSDESASKAHRLSA